MTPRPCLDTLGAYLPDQRDATPEPPAYLDLHLVLAYRISERSAACAKDWIPAAKPSKDWSGVK